MITQDELKDLLYYNPDTGIFTWKTRKSGRKNTGVAGGNGSYSFICVNGKKWYSHRLAFLYMTGSIPEVVDHIDHNTSNNRWSNLREVTRQQNYFNGSKHKDNTSGFKGVTFNKRVKKTPYFARISLNYKRIHLGSYPTAIEAAIAYDNAAIEYYKEFKYLNFPIK